MWWLPCFPLLEESELIAGSSTSYPVSRRWLYQKIFLDLTFSKGRKFAKAQQFAFK